MRLLWTPEALEDLKNISLHIEMQRDLATANRVCRTIYEGAHSLLRNPHAGRQGRSLNTRELVVSRLPMYLIIYRVGDSKSIEVLRIWHASRQRQ